MNSPARSLGQSYVGSLFERMGGKVEGGTVLEVGCGGGFGVVIILERLGAKTVSAIDLDPKMLEVARKRLAHYDTRQVSLKEADVTSLEAEDATFDAVFDFGAIHLEPSWKKALAEVARVLKPGGRYYFELVTSRPLRVIYPLFSDGFATMETPNSDSFIKELEGLGIKVGGSFVRPRIAAITGWVGDLVGVGSRSESLAC